MATAIAKPSNRRKAGRSSNAKLKTLRAVLYLRRSDKDQKESIEQQRDILTSWIEKKIFTIDESKYRLKIVGEYEEDGISGDSTEKRQAFQRMIADAPLGHFDVILCWNQKRFGRFASDESGYYTFPLRKRGIRLITHEEGVIDWTTDMGRMTHAMRQEGAHKDLTGE